MTQLICPTQLKLMELLKTPLCGHGIIGTYGAQVGQGEQYVSYFSLFKKGQCQNITLKSQGNYSYCSKTRITSHSLCFECPKVEATRPIKEN